MTSGVAFSPGEFPFRASNRIRCPSNRGETICYSPPTRLPSRQVCCSLARHLHRLFPNDPDCSGHANRASAMTPGPCDPVVRLAPVPEIHRHVARKFAPDRPAARRPRPVLRLRCPWSGLADVLASLQRRDGSRRSRASRGREPDGHLGQSDEQADGSPRLQRPFALCIAVSKAAAFNALAGDVSGS